MSLPKSLRFRALFTFAFFLASLFFLSVAYSNYQSFTKLLHRPRIAYREGLATNWSGYAIATNLVAPQVGSISDVQATWVVPHLNCDFRNSYSALWTGIDGYLSATVEQIGTESDCYHGQAYHFAWFEIYPGDLHPLTFPIKSGDIIKAEVKYLGNDQFRLSLQNGSTSYQITQRVHADRSSAEWIAEAPSYYNYVLPLADFKITGFRATQAAINGHLGSPTDKNWQNDPLTMVDWHGIIRAYPSVIGSNGSFNVIWNHP